MVECNALTVSSDVPDHHEEAAFWAALDAGLPWWRDQRSYPLVFAGFRRSGVSERDARVEEVVTLTLGRTTRPAVRPRWRPPPTLDSTRPLSEVLHRTLDRVAARDAIERTLRKTPAYGAEWVEPQSAKRVADAFVACFSPQATFWTNLGKVSGSWTPLTSATFDAGVVAADDVAAGILWTADED